MASFNWSAVGLMMTWLLIISTSMSPFLTRSVMSLVPTTAGSSRERAMMEVGGTATDVGDEAQHVFQVDLSGFRRGQVFGDQDDLFVDGAQVDNGDAQYVLDQTVPMSRKSVARSRR